MLTAVTSNANISVKTHEEFQAWDQKLKDLALEISKQNEPGESQLNEFVGRAMVLLRSAPQIAQDVDSLVAYSQVVESVRRWISYLSYYKIIVPPVDLPPSTNKTRPEIGRGSSGLGSEPAAPFPLAAEATAYSERYKP